MRLSIGIVLMVLACLASPVTGQVVFTVTSTGDSGDSNLADNLCDDGTGVCTLRAAIEQANATAGGDTIAFNIPGAGPHAIRPASALPAIIDQVVINGYTQPGAAPAAGATPAVLLIEIDGALAGSPVDGLVIAASNSTVRGLAIHSFSDEGISLEGDGNIIRGNHIGTDVTGTIAMGNNNGIVIVSDGNTIGGTTAARRNVISGNVSLGVVVTGADNDVKGNFIGTDATGMLALGNFTGVSVPGSGNRIGGRIASDAGNLISGNGFTGVSLTGSDNVVHGNRIGTDRPGTGALGNGGNGVQVLGDDNVIGGLLLLAGNVISANGVGVFISEGASGNRLRGNLIGTDVSGVGALGNGAAILVEDGSGNTIGGPRFLHGNRIAFNGAGVLVRNGTGNAILSNAILSNGDGGIDLNVDGVTANDAGDGDVGPNGLQNYPVLTAAEAKAGFTFVEGSLNSAPNTVFRLQFFANLACDASGHGEGERFLGGFLVTTDAAGDVAFSRTLSGATLGGESITATATDPNDSTSEFSACVVAVPGP